MLYPNKRKIRPVTLFYKTELVGTHNKLRMAEGLTTPRKRPADGSGEGEPSLKKRCGDLSSTHDIDKEKLLGEARTWLPCRQGYKLVGAGQRIWHSVQQWWTDDKGILAAKRHPCCKYSTEVIKSTKAV